ncbi:MAG: L,D-transpeptidase [Pseudomonadota bacterium]
MPESIVINLVSQTLSGVHDGKPFEFPVSTAARGAGQRHGSLQTPLGQHIVRARIGAGVAPDTVFVGRRATGEIWTPALHAAHPGRDWILTRILWLSGTERGRNRMGEVDSMRRYIYIHGTPAVEPMGVPASHGCVRMRNAALIWLFDRTDVGTVVTIMDELPAAPPSTYRDGGGA